MLIKLVKLINVSQNHEDFTDFLITHCKSFTFLNYNFILLKSMEVSGLGHYNN